MFRKKLSFTKVLKVIERIDYQLGLFVMLDSPKKVKEKLRILILPLIILLVGILATSTLVITRFKLINIILLMLVLTILISSYLMMYKLMYHKAEFRKLLEWCWNLYDIKTKFHPYFHKIAEAHVMAMERRSLWMFKWLKILFYANILSFTLGYSFIGHYLPDNLFPKFSPPTPFLMPFKNQKTWPAFITNVLAQTIVCLHVATALIYIFGSIYCIAIHIFGVFDIIYEIINKWKLEIQIEEPCNNETAQPLKLQKRILTVINQSNDTANTRLEFNEWVQNITEMICDVNSIISDINNLFTEFFLSMEISTLGTFLMSGLIVTILHEQYVFAIGLFCISFFLFSACYISEKIMDGFDGIKEALYDIPWYTLDTKQRKMLLILMNCDELQDGFIALGIHNLTLERFGTIIKAGYSNLLVLKDVVA